MKYYGCTIKSNNYSVTLVKLNKCRFTDMTIAIFAKYTVQREYLKTVYY